jgi:hypothetical protein
MHVQLPARLCAVTRWWARRLWGPTCQRSRCAAAAGWAAGAGPAAPRQLMPAARSPTPSDLSRRESVGQQVRQKLKALAPALGPAPTGRAGRVRPRAGPRSTRRASPAGHLRDPLEPQTSARRTCVVAPQQQVARRHIERKASPQKSRARILHAVAEACGAFARESIDARGQYARCNTHCVLAECGSRARTRAAAWPARRPRGCASQCKLGPARAHAASARTRPGGYPAG